MPVVIRQYIWSDKDRASKIVNAQLALGFMTEEVLGECLSSQPLPDQNVYLVHKHFTTRKNVCRSNFCSMPSVNGMVEVLNLSAGSPVQVAWILSGKYLMGTIFKHIAELSYGQN